MRISFDLDDTLICYGDGVACAPRLSWWRRAIVGDEPLRRGTRELIDTLRRRGHEVWIYTSSGRRARAIRWWLRAHGVRVDGIVDGARHAAAFGVGSLPTKRPHAFGIDLHVDDSPGVALEGSRFGFAVFVVAPTDEKWADRVLAAVEGASDPREGRTPGKSTGHPV